MESLEGMTCGVWGHDWDCLCDVRISQEIPINRYAVQGLWMGQEVADANGYENWDNPQEVLNYLCDVLFLHDCVAFQSQYCDSGPEQLTPVVGTTFVHPYRSIRVKVRQAMSTPGATIRNVLGDIGITAEQFTRAASSGHWEMSMTTLEEFERVIMESNPTYGELGARFSLAESTLRKFRLYWPHQTKDKVRRGKGGQPYQVRMRELIADGISTSTIVKMLADEFGVTLTPSAVSLAKRRMRRKLTTHVTRTARINPDN
jgi:hypothetical protein